MDLTLLRSLNMRRKHSSVPNTSGQDTGKEVVELVDHEEKLERSKEREERRARRSVGSADSGGEPRQFSGDEVQRFSGGEPRLRAAPLHTLSLLVTLAGLPLSDKCLASLLCSIADHPLLASAAHTLEDGERGRNCGGGKCGMFLF